MKANWESLARRLLLTGGLCVWLGAMTAWSQEAPPPAPGTAEQGVAGDAKEGDKGAKEKAADSAADNTKSPAPGASGTAPGTSETSPGRAETTPGTAGTAPGRAGTTPAAEGAKGAAKSDPFDGPTDTTREGARTAARDAREGVQDAAGNEREAAREATRSLREGAQEAGREAREGTRDLREGTREATGDLRDGAREAGRDAREGARDLREGTRDEGRDLREGARDSARDFREGAQDARRDAREGARDLREGALDDARDLREGAREGGRDFREGAQDARRDAREGARDLREDTREGARDFREGARDARESFREERADLRDDTRRPRQDADLRGSARDFRDDRFDSRSQERFREDRSTARDERSFRDDREFRERSTVRSDTRMLAGTLRPADLGIWFGRSTGEGLVISDIATTGPMATLISDFGFREGDRIVSVDGYRVTRDSDFVRFLLSDEVLYDEVPVVVMRDGRRTTLYVEPIRLVEQVQRVEVDPLENFGVIVDDRIDDRVTVWRVVPRSPAFYAGIQPGDVITTFQGQRVTGPDAFVQLVERAEPGRIAVEVNRDQRVRQFEVETWPIEGRSTARASLRPEYDDPSIERFSERREDRIEDRREMRFDGSDGYVVPPTRAPAGPVRRALFPRLRGR